MTYDPSKHHRRSIRLKDYDYTQPGVYFVTLCTQGRVCLFGRLYRKTFPQMYPKWFLMTQGV